jgi:hypothetical protein
MPRLTDILAVRERTFLLGATAIAAGVTALWSGAAEAITVVPDLVTDVYDQPLGSSQYNVTLGNGDPFGQPQFSFSENGITAIPASSGVIGFTCLDPVSCGPETGDNKASSLSPGTVVGPGDTFLYGSDTFLYYDNIPKDEYVGYIGLQFDIASDESLSSDVVDPYGYANISDGTLISITYDANGGPVTIPGTTSAVPEPASLSLLALGAAGVLALRRRRRKPDARA